MTSDEYTIHMDRIYREFRDMRLCAGNTTIVPKYLGIHLANRGCSSKCRFCVSGGEKFDELALENQEEFLYNLQHLLRLNDDKDGYIKEIHFDGDSSDPILPKTSILFQRSIELIRRIEAKDGKNRLIQVITNGHFINKLSKEILLQLDLISISVNAYDKPNYKLYTCTDAFELVMSNIAMLCKLRDDNHTNQFINAGYVLSRDEAKGITNFSESSIEDFVYCLHHTGVNNVKFRFDFHEKSRQYQEDVTSFIKSLSDSGKFKPMTINIQQPHECPGFKYCLSPFLWPVLGPNIKLYACPHSIKNEMEAYYERDSVSLIETDKGPLCNSICQPFMFGLNKRFNNDLKNNPDLLEAVKKCGYSRTIYPLVKEIL
jgi:wyosine [tRNA(Phe)-imidazoG37] synthetase (radical SAM superfamily)